jgi:membrane protein implicated in regulation of membrane protease activity
VILLISILIVVLVPVEEPWGAVIIIAGCLLEVVEITVLRKWSKHMGKTMKPTTGAEAMIGKTATVVSPCRPRGTVRVHGELWDARCDDGADPGATVRVDAIDGLLLVVSAHA